ncbi:hypothetical protein [Alkalimonas sp.]|uniref:hypothetical protein n=1 Tax=Alkalimonas sp. TaxID=1872453 RepID=UPI00263B713D|nr:hypothetical protein [Alkalimonas sp.]MCC5825809.1 hypothetical protein [Alkalimonas sp.]
MQTTMHKACMIFLLATGLLACSQSPKYDVNALSQAQLQQLKDPDQDGVIRQRDLCAQTISGALVTVDGCSKQQAQQFTSVHAVQFYRVDPILACQELRSLLALIKRFQLSDDPLKLTIFAHQLPDQPALDRELFDTRVAYLKERLWAEYREQLPPIEVKVETVTAAEPFVMKANQLGIRAYNLATGEVMRWHIYSMEGRQQSEVEAHSASGW